MFRFPFSVGVSGLSAWLLLGCGGGGGSLPAAVCSGEACAAFAQRDVQRLATPWVEGGVAQTLEVVVYRPLGTNGPLPTLIVHHGSTGSGDKPALFSQTFDSPEIAREFTAQGFLVLFPQRRGRGASDGVYDEGFEPDRSRYSCRHTHAVPGLLRALDDAQVIADQVRQRADVDAARLFVGGVSRGGLVALVHAARSPGVYRGAINFVGGWLGEGCVDAFAVNRGAFTAATPFAGPTLWLYGENDPFYGIPHSRGHYDAFVAGGGQGQWLQLRRTDPTVSGHGIHNEPALWRNAVAAFLTVASRNP